MLRTQLVRKEKSGEAFKLALRPSFSSSSTTFTKALHFSENLEQTRHFLQRDLHIKSAPTYTQIGYLILADSKHREDEGCGLVNDGGWLTGYGSLGFHSLGNRTGTWLTQIFGQIENPDKNPYVWNPACVGAGLYMDVTYADDTAPIARQPQWTRDFFGGGGATAKYFGNFGA